LTIIASEPDYPPFYIVDKNGKADGSSVDLFKAAAKVVDIEVDIKIGIWNQIKQDLAEGKIDALPLVGRTPEREPLYDFTLPYLILHVKKGNKDLLSRLNEGISIVIANRTYDRIHLKWFGQSIQKQIALKDVIRIALPYFSLKTLSLASWHNYKQCLSYYSYQPAIYYSVSNGQFKINNI
jgi:ABC-type amino acid transport substrate-binding protein